jgi:hypothetical protein
VNSVKINELSDDKFDIEQEIEAFELSKAEFKKNSAIYKTIIQNSDNLNTIEAKFP